jgi:hypothetical protein
MVREETSGQLTVLFTYLMTRPGHGSGHRSGHRLDHRSGVSVCVLAANGHGHST